MKKFSILLSLVLVVTFLASPANAIIGFELEDIISGCTIGVHNSYTTTHNSPVLWKVADVSDKDIQKAPEDLCAIVKYFSTDDWGTEYNFIALTYTWEGLEPHKRIISGLNEAGVGTGNSLVSVDDYDNNNLLFMFHVLGSYDEIDEIRDYIASDLGKTEYNPSGCFPFIDNDGNAFMFELDSSNNRYWEYDTMDDDRDDQGLKGFVVRANEFHVHEDGTDDTDVMFRYLTGTENALGLIDAGQFNEQSVVQSDSDGEYRLIRQDDIPWPISNDWSRNAIVIRGAAPGEDPALATMWALLGNPSFSIAVPTWATVSEIPDPIGTCAMHTAVTTLVERSPSNRGQQIEAGWAQAAVLPAEAHLFDMINNRILPYWRTLKDPPAVTEMTRIEHQMAQDAYSVVNYLASTGDHNLAPTVDFEAQKGASMQYTFSANAADTDGGVVSYLWDFGDGTASTEGTPLHEFPNAGVYLVSVTVADDDGVTTTAWRYLTISEE